MLRSVLIFATCASLSALLPVLYGNFKAPLPVRASVEAEPVPDASVAAQRPATGALSGRSERIAANGSGHFLADFRLNGRRIPALVDTGATYVAINRSTARSLGVALSPADFKYTLDTANGTTHAAAVTLDRVELGRIRVEDVEAVVLEDKALSGTLIGMSFLKRLDRYSVEDSSLLLAQ